MQTSLPVVVATLLHLSSEFVTKKQFDNAQHDSIQNNIKNAENKTNYSTLINKDSHHDGNISEQSNEADFLGEYDYSGEDDWNSYLFMSKLLFAVEKEPLKTNVILQTFLSLHGNKIRPSFQRDPPTKGSDVFDSTEFFKRFPKIWLLNFKINEIRDILQAAALYNRANGQKRDSVCVEIWIQNHLEDSTIERLKEYVAMFRETNYLYPGTVTTIVLPVFKSDAWAVGGADNYEEDEPNLGSIAKTQTEIEKLKNYIAFIKKENSAHENSSILINGFVHVNSIACEEFWKLFVTDLHMLYYLVDFDPNIFHAASSNSMEDTHYICRNKTSDKFYQTNKAKVGLSFRAWQHNYALSYNFDDKLSEIRAYNSSENTFHKSVERFQKNHGAPIAFSYTSQTRPLKVPTKLDCNMTTEIKLWYKVRRPTNKKRLGYSVYFGTDLLNYTESLVYSVVQKSPVILLENWKQEFTLKLVNSLETLLDSITTAVEKFNKVSYPAKEPLSLRTVYIRLNFWRVPLNQTFRTFMSTSHFADWVGMVVRLAAKANKRMPGLVDTVVVGIPKFIQPDYDEIFLQVRKDQVNIGHGPRLGYEFDLIDAKDNYYGVSCPLKQLSTTADVLLLVSHTHVTDCYRIEEYTKLYNDYVSACLGELQRSKSNTEIALYNRLRLCSNEEIEYQRYAVITESLNLLSYMHDMTIFAGEFFELTWSNKTDFWLYPIISIENPFDTCGRWIARHAKNFSNIWLLDKLSVVENSYRKTINASNSDNRLHIGNHSNVENTWMSITVIAFFVFLLVILGMGYRVVKYRKIIKLERKEILYFLNGAKRPLSDVLDAANLEPFENKYDKTRHEVSSRSFKIDQDHCLGCGEFGIVCKGSITKENDEIVVAVKTIKRRSKVFHPDNLPHLKSLLSEIKILSYIGDHPNIIQLIGANTESIHSGVVWVFLEYCSYGSLMTYLRKLRTETEETKLKVDQALHEYENIALKSNSLNQEVLTDMYKWSQQIAVGMCHIATKKLVHADLAARNILLSSDKVAKIADFGLSKRIYDSKQYVTSDEKALPWRWMAPEALTQMEFSEKTDVWAFGVLLWEIFSFGDTPYPGLSWNVEFANWIREGLNPGEPTYVSKTAYEIMLHCWKIKSEERPKFSEIQNMFLETQSET